LSPTINEFRYTASFLSLALNLGLFVGALFWGIGCDIWGRRYVELVSAPRAKTESLNRWSFNLTLLITGIFGLCAGAAPNFITLASLFAVAGVGVGGNLPIDSAVFLGMYGYSHAII
jgi:MFS family permease